MEDFIGTIKMFAGTFAPKDWAFCDGKLMSIQENTAMYSILGNQYGGDGITTFAVPNLEKEKSSQGEGINHIICMYGIFPSRS
ncbi:phage tail protein [Flavobacterium sp. ZT3R25]|uniref:phage tail protein n=1 Tax=Flavobacterium galactosi TaxID=3398735 RepID=UPI003A85D4A4